MTDFSLEVFQNEYVPAQATTMGAVVTVTPRGSPRSARRGGRDPHHRHVGLDVLAARAHPRRHPGGRAGRRPHPRRRPLRDRGQQPRRHHRLPGMG